MNIRQQLLKKHSRENADFVETHVVKTPGAVVELMVCFLSDETTVVQRSAQVVGNLGRHHPEMLQPWWEEMRSFDTRGGCCFRHAVRRRPPSKVS